MSDAVESEFGRDEPEPFAPALTPWEARQHPDSAAEWARSVPPSSDALAVLSAVDFTAMDASGLVDAIGGLERVLAHVSALQYEAIAVLEQKYPEPELAPGTWVSGKHEAWASVEVAAVLRTSDQAAACRVSEARELADRLPKTRDALCRGELTVRHARAMTSASSHLADPGLCSKLEDRVLTRDARQTGAQFARSVKRVVLALAPKKADERHTEAMDERGVWADPPGLDGMAWGRMHLPADTVAALMAVLNDAAERCGASDPRTMDQRRADALGQLAFNVINGVSGPLTCGHVGPDGSPVRTGTRPDVKVVIALSTLLGLDDQPGELNGHPIPAELARRIAADPTGTWRRILTDERGVLLAYGRTRYRPPPGLADHVAARDRECTHPNCTRPAETSDIDHQTRWIDGGGTNDPNLAILCRRHHRAKDEAGWKKQRQPDGSTTWTSPTGRTYVKPAASYPVDTTGLSDPSDDDPPPF